MNLENRCGGLFLTLFLPLLPASNVLAAESEVLREIWYVSRIAGAESGSYRQRVSTVNDDGSAAFRTVTSTTLVLERFGRERTVRTESWTLEDTAGRLLRIHHREIDSGHETICDVVAQGDEAALTLTSLGAPETSMIPWDPDLLGPVGIQKLRREKGFSSGTGYSYKTFSTDYAKAITVSVAVRGSAETELLDRRRATLIHVEGAIDLLPGVTVNEWWDEEGEVIKTSITMMGRARETFRTSGERATHAEKTESKADLLLEAVSHSNINLPNPYRLDSILYTFESRNKDIEFPAGIDDIRQKTIDSDGSAATVLVRALNPTGYQKRPLKNPPDAIAPFLEPNPYLQCRDGTLGARAAQVVGRETDAWKAAQRLESFVFEHIAEKKLATGFASAADVFEKKSGDSRSHAVLLACLCRSQGIPARVAMGYTYLGGIFGGGAATMARAHGFVGALIEGAVRDSHDLREMKFPAFSRTVCPGYIVSKVSAVALNDPVTIGGRTIRGDDAIVGDNDGVVVIGPDELDEVIARAFAIEEWEHRMHALQAKGATVADAIDSAGPMP